MFLEGRHFRDCVYLQSCWRLVSSAVPQSDEAERNVEKGSDTLSTLLLGAS